MYAKLDLQCLHQKMISDIKAIDICTIIRNKLFQYKASKEKVSKHFVSYAGAEPFQLATCEKAKQNFQKILFAQRVIWY